MRGSIIYLLGIVLAVISCGRSLPNDVAQAMKEIPEVVSYNFHVKPILSDRCYSCHGPDEVARKADLRLDIEQDAKRSLESGNFAIKNRKWKQSALCNRILSEDPEQQMPPPDSKLTLNDHERAILIRWIEQGAVYEPHWAFIKPERPDVPEVEDQDLVQNDIDPFILKELDLQGLSISPPAEKERLLHRAFMDLTGLPPSIDDINDFIQDQSPDAFEKLVDKVLQSDACAERLAMEWMDVSRYADSHGMHADGWRNMWPWRDWVIHAFGKNMPYDEFITLQLAGDLLPDAGREEILATAFHRNHPMTAEGGAIEEEFRLEYVADRTNTTATALMGLTMECAKCHDHKFDPISQAEYYGMSAFFNNQKELGMTGDDGNYGPMLTLESTSTRMKLATLDQQIDELTHDALKKEGDIEKIRSYLDEIPSNINLKRDITAYFPLERLDKKKEKEQTRLIVDLQSICSSNGKPELIEGVVGNALEFDDEYDGLYLESLGLIDVHQPLSSAMWMNTVKRNPEKTQVLIGNAGDKNNFWRGWDFYLDQSNRLCFRLIHALPHNYLHIQSLDSIGLNQWTHVAFSYDGSGNAQGCKLFIDGKQSQLKVVYNKLNKNIRTITGGPQTEVDRALLVGKSYRSFTGDNGIFKGKIDEIRIYDREISNLEVATMAGVKENRITEADKWSHIFVHDPQLQAIKSRRSQLVKEAVAIRDTIPEIMVMEEMPQTRATFVLSRGQYNAPLARVKPNTPSEILPFPDDLPENRLGLAEWLFHPDHPLTSRAAVNRYWQMIFGTGIVKTANDFGRQGALPSHPELLDWLAVEFMESGWDIKALLKLMVMSATYQRSSLTSKEQREVDPENVWLSRSPSYRWPAEMIRDNALAASGLLVKTVGGPSVKPYQPEGLWIEKGTFSHKLLRYEEDEGDGLYRRSLYTFIKRTSPHPAMTVFDAPSRDVCTVTRETTNTPLQALVLLNDPQFVEAARVLAERIQKEGGTSFDSRVSLAFRLATGRTPTSDEIEVLKSTFDMQLAAYEADPGSAKELLSVGKRRIDPTLPSSQTAALTVVASTVLNHDEAYMKR